MRLASRTFCRKSLLPPIDCNWRCDAADVSRRRMAHAASSCRRNRLKAEPTSTLFMGLDRPCSSTMESRMDLKNQIAVVTGGTRGLGLGIVEALLERGTKVTVVAGHQSGLDDVERRLGV